MSPHKRRRRVRLAYLRALRRAARPGSVSGQAMAPPWLEREYHREVAEAIARERER